MQKTNSFFLPRSWRFVCGLHKIGFGLILRDDERHRPLQVYRNFYSCLQGIRQLPVDFNRQSENRPLIALSSLLPKPKMRLQ